MSAAILPFPSHRMARRTERHAGEFAVGDSVVLDDGSTATVYGRCLALAPGETRFVKEYMVRGEGFARVVPAERIVKPCEGPR